MARQKRQYVPKIKGCYECSQRRIHCDRKEPACGKCLSKGLECSGFGIRYRFCNDVAARKKGRARRASCSTSSSSSSSSSGRPDDVCVSTVKTRDLPRETEEYLWPMRHEEDEVEDVPRRMSLVHDLDLVDPRTEFLLTYFSENIAPEMVVIDDIYNGWRNLILPMAFLDELVMNSVLAVSSFHISQRVLGTQQPMDPNALYGRVINALQSRSNLTEYDSHRRQLVLVTIVVMLVGVMVNGCSDFPILFNMLQSALDAMGGETGLGRGELAEFLMRQIHKMQVYAAPMLSRDAGVYHILFHAEQSFDCLHYYSSLYPDHSSTLLLIEQLRQQAYQIYISRALKLDDNNDNDEASVEVDRFKALLETFPPGSPGEHSLVWACFIVASESRSAEHRQFFKQFLERQYQRNGFVNITRAMGLLKRIWSREREENWAELLPEPQVFIM